MAAKKVLEIRIKLDTRLPRVLQADALRLQQVLLNLAGNAIKFTERGYICLLVQQIERSPNQVLVQFIVEDSGIGIADDRLNAIFENFEQEDASTSRRFGGTGLGLPISQRLVQLMGGELHVSSQLGQGSSFAFRLRLPWSPEDQQLLRQDQPLEQHFPEYRFDHEAEAEPLAGLRILVTEDNALNQQLVQTLLSQAGTEVVLANNGQEAVETIKRGLPIIHAVLMDIQMPVMDGYEATRLIRTQAGDALPIIAMTANSLASERETYLKAGMDDHIAKPFNIQDLIELLLRHLDRYFIPASRSTSTTMLDGSIDSQAALKRMNNNEELYARLLRDFVASQAEIPEQVEEALAHNDTTTALRLLHSLKGLAATLGIMELHKAAAAAEAELKLSASSPAWPTALARLKARLSTDVQQIQTVAGRLNTAAEPLPVKTDSDQAILLLVDDQPINLEVLKGIFAGDYGLLEAQSGAQTLQLCRSLPRPDLVLLDVLMPDMDGLEVCRQLKADPLTADIPIIFITAQTTADEETAALECGGVDFISKPITPAVIQARVRTQLTLKQQRDQLQALAMIDGLTQIANRRHFDEALQTECQRAQRHQSHLALLLIDIDHFKAYNDHYGHQQGDICLQQVAATLAACCRRALDLVARYGGEEFSCLLPDCDLDSARIKAEELRQAIAALHLPHASSPVAPHVSISIGIAVCLSASANPQQLIAAADKALYAAKAAGRNRVSF
jgi:diguanylate cyclase (GGDEF)-like protein